MEGRCRRCGEKLSLLQRLQGQDFCSPEHKAEFQREQEEMALARLQQSATTLKRPEGGKVSTKTGLRESSSSSHSAIELRRETEPPMAGFFDFWYSSTQIPPLPPELREEELIAGPKYPPPATMLAVWTTGLEQIPPVPRAQPGDLITTLPPRTVSILTPVAPAVPVHSGTAEAFPWEAMSLMLDEGPPEAGLVALRPLRVRVNEPMVRWLEPFEVDFSLAAPAVPRPKFSTLVSREPALAERVFSLAGLVLLRDSESLVREGDGPAAACAPPMASGADLEPAARLAPNPADLVSPRVRFGFRRPRRHRIPATAETPQPRPCVADGSRSILSPMLSQLAGPSRRSSAKPARASAKPLPHFSAVPVPVRPKGYDYAPNLNPIAITSNWLAPVVPISLTAKPAGEVSVVSPFLGAGIAVPAPVCGTASRQLDGTANAWATPPLARCVAIECGVAASRPFSLAGPEEHQNFTLAPRAATLITSMRAVVPPMRRRIKMEVHLEPPRPTPWFEPLTCAFGGDPYGAR